jgi:hypothetical protein
MSTENPTSVTTTPVTGTTPKTETQNTETNSEILTWEEYLAKQDVSIQALYKSHTDGLLNTVKATREERDALRKQIKEISKKAEDGSELRGQLEQLQLDLEKTERRAMFLEEASKPEVQCRNPRAAFLLAEAENLFDKKGNANWTAIREAAPELFGMPTARANAANGTEKPPVPTKSMNNFLRTATGRQ